MAKTKKSGSHPNSPAENLIKICFFNSLHMFESPEEDDEIEAYDLTGPVLKRRKEATLSVLPQVRDEFGHYYLKRDRLREDFVTLSSAPGVPLMSLERDCHISMACAVWMLDDLLQSGSLNEARSFLPSADADFFVGNLPSNLFDICHNGPDLQNMIYLVQNRDLDAPHRNHYLNSVTAKRTKPVRVLKKDLEQPPEEMSGRDRFNAVMNLIRPEEKEQAVHAFEAKYREYLDLIFSLCSSSANRPIQMLQKANEEIGGGSAKAPLRLGNSEQTPSYDYNDESRDIVRRFNLVSTALPVLMGAGNARECGISQEDYDKIRSFDVEDPFEICFGYLCLIENGSDLPWVYSAAEAVLASAGLKLPWADPSTEDIVWVKDEMDEEVPLVREKKGGTEETEKTEPLNDTSADSGSQKERQRTAELYRARYTADILASSGQNPDPLSKLNLPQVVFRSTGLFIPRVYHNWSDWQDRLIQSGMDPSLAQGMELYLNLAREIRYQLMENQDTVLEIDKVVNQAEIPSGLLQPADPGSDAAAPIPEEGKNSAAELEQLREENLRLKQLLDEVTPSRP